MIGYLIIHGITYYLFLIGPYLSIIIDKLLIFL